MTGFAAQVKAFSDKTREKQGRAIRKIALDAFSSVILMTPVDTGRARGNWQTAVSVVPSGTLERFDPTGQAPIAEAQTAVGAFMPGMVVYLANNLPYAQRLEDGWSKQAPSGMVGLTRQRFQPIADAVLRQIGAE